MKKFFHMFVIVSILMLSACQTSSQDNRFKFGEDLAFIEENGNYRIDIDQSSQVVKDKYDDMSKTLTNKEVLHDIAAVTTTTANILSQAGIQPTAAPTSKSLDEGITNKQYDLKETKKIDKSKVLNIGSALSPNIEAIVELEPQLALYSDAMPKTSFIENLEAANIKTAPLGQSDYIDMFILLDRINTVTNYENEASCKQMNTMVSSLKAVTETISKADNAKQTVAILQVAEGSVYINNKDTVLGGVVEALNLENVFAKSENGELNKEQLLTQNPDYIIYYTHGKNVDVIANFEKELQSEESVYRELSAIKNGKTFQVASNDFIFASSVDFDIIKIIQFLVEKFNE